MKKIGILSLYHNNYNYGGLLQAFSLVYVLNKNGNIEAKQIAYAAESDINPLKKSRMERFKEGPYKFIKKAIANKFKNYKYKIIYFFKGKKLKQNLELRKKSFKEFEACIPHTELIHSFELDKLNDIFDFFICGSDQVWNPDFLREAYLLSFVNKNEKKISYAASIGKDCLQKDELEYLTTRIKDFKGISVREKQSQTILEKEIGDTVEYVLDPTLLLSAEEWSRLSQQYYMSEKYILSYFLGDDLNQRKITKEFAQSKGIKLLGFPYILGKYRKCDNNFADMELYDVTPFQFVYLIAHAEYVITDSFHASVFSVLFNRKFVVFDRKLSKNIGKMNSRIESLLKMFGLSYRFVSPEKISVIDDELDIDYSMFNQMKDRSYAFLNNIT